MVILLNVDIKILIVTKNSTKLMFIVFIPGFTATYCHAQSLLTVPKAQKAALIIGTSENESISVSGDDKI